MDSNKHEGGTESVPVSTPATQISQLQALASELKAGFTEAMQELSRIQHGEYALEEKVKSCRCAMEEKVAEMKNSLNTFKEELSDAKSMIEEISAKQEEMQQKIEQLQQEKRRESRKMKAKRAQKDDHGSQTVPTPLQGSPFRSINLPEPVLMSEDFTSLLHNVTYEKVSDTRIMPMGEGGVKVIAGPAKRQNIALELLESERKYVINLSLILKIKATLQGPDVKRSTKERSFFPNSLRFLVQQHVDLLHALQERVLSWPRQGILGDIFLKLTNDENNFLDYYVAYLRDLPECISLIHVVILKEVEEEIKSDLYILFFHIVQRIPEYLIHLQNVLKFTEQEHPDYYLLLVCVQRLRVFISHYSLLFQCNEDLLIQKRKKLKNPTMDFSSLRSSLVKLYKGLTSQCTSQEVSPTPSAASMRDSGIHTEEAIQSFPAAPSSGTTTPHLMPQMKKPQPTVMENIQAVKPPDWEMESRKHERPENILASSQLTEQELKALTAPLQSIPEMEYEAPPADAVGNTERAIRTSVELLQDARNFAPSYEEFDYPGEVFTMPGPYEDDTFQNLALFENCSPASSESSLDICFLRPVNFTSEPERTDHALQPLPKSCTPVSSSTYKREMFHSKGKQLSRSLKELPRSAEGVSTRLYSTRSSSGSRLQQKQDRNVQPHLISASSRSSQRSYFPPQRGAGEKPSFLEELHAEDNTRFCQKDDNEQTSFSDHNPRHEPKGGFRSSFRKLFKKK
ncbi:rho guanine nucleotide exchange factor 33 isoform X5 [Corvus cornix cornix]|uniref:rho guanine nucleotide exchange factor 33 isoform X5 n=1 Tax=Corvus brachyrhynchos TaxID=85066 RepID=UPI0008167CC2|nr:PREDICTED: rho guanine nucleotide exchange factor 33 isoform X5 [Corvus brachyrhynchos]XP_019148360.2 rho guanine nucleotide exchange factor 33 isoform X5 [Corvus cornix cornix]XP_031959317.1 rho guanine nucleotide exchange factor 33 isoform X5 [Corvus moneduloides]